MATRSAQQGTARGWWFSEQAIEIGEVPQHVARRANGRPVHVNSVWRWVTAGLHGIRLRRFKSGSRWCTTVEELRRFEQALTAAAEAGAC